MVQAKNKSENWLKLKNAVEGHVSLLGTGGLNDMHIPNKRSKLLFQQPSFPLSATSVSFLQGGINENSKDQKPDCHNEVKNHQIRGKIGINHHFPPFTTIKLPLQQIAVRNSADASTGNLAMSRLKKNGTITEAKRISPLTINISDSLSSCESVNKSCIHGDASISASALSMKG